MDFLVKNTPLGISAEPEDTFDALKTASSDYLTAVTQQLQVTIPNLEKVSDAGVIGNGGYVTAHVNDYFSHSGITITDRLNTSLAAIYLARILGGDITTEEVTEDVSWDHTIEVLALDQDPQLVSSSFAFKAGGLDLLLSGMVGNGFSLNFADAAAPTFAAEFVGSGSFDYWSNQSPAIAALPAFVPQNYMLTSAAIECSYNDGTLLNLSSVGRFKGISLQHNNNTITGDRRPGDKLLVTGNPDKGAIVKRLTRDVPSLAVQLQLFIDQNKREWTNHLDNVTINNLTFKAIGPKIGASTDRHEVEFIVPKGIFTVPQVPGDGQKHTLTLNLEPQLKSGEKGYFKVRVRNGSDTLV